MAGLLPKLGGALGVSTDVPVLGPILGDGGAGQTGAPNSSAQQSGGNGGAKLMPALPIALGSVGGVLIFGLIIGMLYRKSKWPFHKRRNFAEIDDLEVERQQEIERQQKMKWDPRVTRTFKQQQAAAAGVNF
ncbi:hypothetical protein K4K53_007597 [Colletotrichum sp. SAR 10_77]|nr:hypothetical protein K4K53_007597 [Colletotrichum sp. SAR 10_77]KAI8301703.1 hypothetical protein K4K59_000936 [Colletotrichum sp. SAR11_240]